MAVQYTPHGIVNRATDPQFGVNSAVSGRARQKGLVNLNIPRWWQGRDLIREGFGTLDPNRPDLYQYLGSAPDVVQNSARQRLGLDPNFSFTAGRLGLPTFVDNPVTGSASGVFTTPPMNLQNEINTVGRLPTTPQDFTGLLDSFLLNAQQVLNLGQAAGQQVPDIQAAAAPSFLPALNQLVTLALQAGVDVSQNPLVDSVLRYQGLNPAGFAPPPPQLQVQGSDAGIPNQKQTIQMGPTSPQQKQTISQPAASPQIVASSSPSQQKQVLTQGPAAPPIPTAQPAPLSNFPFIRPSFGPIADWNDPVGLSAYNAYGPVDLNQVNWENAQNAMLTALNTVLGGRNLGASTSTPSAQKQTMTQGPAPQAMPQAAPAANIFQGQFQQTPFTAQPGQTQRSTKPLGTAVQQPMTSPYVQELSTLLSQLIGGSPIDALIRTLLSGGQLPNL